MVQLGLSWWLVSHHVYSRFPSPARCSWPRVSVPPWSPSPASRWGCLPRWGAASWASPPGRCLQSTSMMSMVINIIIIDRFIPQGEQGAGHGRPWEPSFGTDQEEENSKADLWVAEIRGQLSSSERSGWWSDHKDIRDSQGNIQTVYPGQTKENKTERKLSVIFRDYFSISINSWFCGLCQGFEQAVCCLYAGKLSWWAL